MQTQSSGFIIGFAEDCNRKNRRQMEDAHRYVVNYNGVSGQGFFAIYDGHAGKQTADWCGENLHLILASHLNSPGTRTIPQILTETFHQADREVASRDLRNSGCTAAVSFLSVVQGKRTLFTANVGDTRVVLCRRQRATRLSYDHKSDDPLEARRVVEAGGFILNSRVNGVLAVTRSLGDSSVKEVVTGAPYTTETEITSHDAFLIIGCDGIWDVISDQGAVDLVRAIGPDDPQKAAEALLRSALDNGSQDNLSAMVVRFLHPWPSPDASDGQSTALGVSRSEAAAVS